MKHLLKTFFFGYLPLGWKRLFWVASFLWWFWLFFIWWINLNDLVDLLLLISPFILSYLISGFIKLK